MENSIVDPIESEQNQPKKESQEPKKTRNPNKIGVLLMLVAGCMYFYFTIPDGQDSRASDAEPYTAAGVSDSSLHHQFAKYQDDVAAARKISSQDSQNTAIKDSLTLKQ